MIKQPLWITLGILLGVGLAAFAGNNQDSNKGNTANASSNPNVQTYQKMLDLAAAQGQAEIAQYYTPPAALSPPTNQISSSTSNTGIGLAPALPVDKSSSIKNNSLPANPYNSTTPPAASPTNDNLNIYLPPSQ